MKTLVLIIALNLHPGNTVRLRLSGKRNLVLNL